MKNCNMTYRSFKYWHAAMIHAKKLPITIAYYMYLECCEGKLDTDWLIKEKKQIYSYELREILYTQMMTYDPR